MRAPADCPANTYSVSGGPCVTCPAHSHTNGPRAATCTCDDGYESRGTFGADLVCTGAPPTPARSLPAHVAHPLLALTAGVAPPLPSPSLAVLCPKDHYGPTCAACAAGCQNNTCADGADGDGACVCQPGWTTERCTECDTSAGWVPDGAGGCTCAPNRFGSGCYKCPSCGDGGHCHDGPLGNGTCVCGDGWAHDGAGRCTQCAPGRFGTDCHQTCPSCHGHGECNDGVGGDGKCACNFGFDPSANCSTCAPGFFPTTDEQGATVCARCHSTCHACSGPSAAECTACHPGMVLTDGACLCDGACADCAAECATCFGPLPTQCTSCAANYTLQGTTCQEACDAGSYQLDGDGGAMCLPCHSTCAACLGGGATDCTSCDADSGRMLDLSTSACVTSCPVGTVQSNGSVCALCDPTCQQCDAPGPDACTACAADRYLLEGECTATCPDGTYPSPQGTCAPCASSCATCANGTSIDCTSCRPPSVLNPSGQCVGACPLQTYNASGVCASCHPTCAYCAGPGDAECTSCLGNFLQDGRCVPSCDDGYYQSGLVCLPCPESCAACASAAACTACANAADFLEDGACVAACSGGYAPRTSPGRHCEPLQPCTHNQYRRPLPDGTCADCHPTCATCSGGLATECVSCAGRFQEETSCVEACSPGYYLNIAVARCSACPEACSACASPAECTACASGADYLEEGACVAACREGYIAREGPPRVCEPLAQCFWGQYYASDENVCLPCHASCLACDGPAATNCTVCLNQLLEDGVCVDACSAGHRQNGTLCVRCPADCATCEDDGQCATCDGGLMLDGGRCVATCPEGKEATEDGAACQPVEALVVEDGGAFEADDIVTAAVIPAALILLTLLVYWICRRIEPRADNLVIFTVSFGLFDVVTDALFVNVLFQNALVSDVLRYVALACVAVPVLVNLVASLAFLSRLAGKTAESNEWFSHYYPLAALVSFVAAGCLGALTLLSSNLCGWRGFQARFDERDLYRIKQLELFTLFVEDLPQLVIQILVISGYGVSPLTIVTLSASVFAVLFNLLQRFFYILGHRSRQRLQQSSKRRGGGGGGGGGGGVAAQYYHDFMNQMFGGGSYDSRTGSTVEMLPTSSALFNTMAVHADANADAGADVDAAAADGAGASAAADEAAGFGLSADEAAADQQFGTPAFQAWLNSRDIPNAT